MPSQQSLLTTPLMSDSPACLHAYLLASQTARLSACSYSSHPIDLISSHSISSNHHTILRIFPSYTYLTHCLSFLFVSYIFALYTSPSNNFTVDWELDSAEAGGLEVTVSHDLRGYLATYSIALSSSSRSSSISFTWGNAAMGKGVREENQGAGSKDGGVCSGSSSSGSSGFSNSEHTVENILYHSITLSSAYQGPTVKNGLPRVYIRTKLTPVGTYSQRNAQGDQWGDMGFGDDGYLKAMPTTSIRENIVRECKMPPWGPGLEQPDGQTERPPVTAICAHPILYQMVVGFMDDSLCIFDCASD